MTPANTREYEALTGNFQNRYVQYKQALTKILDDHISFSNENFGQGQLETLYDMKSQQPLGSIDEQCESLITKLEALMDRLEAFLSVVDDYLDNLDNLATSIADEQSTDNDKYINTLKSRYGDIMKLRNHAEKTGSVIEVTTMELEDLIPHHYHQYTTYGVMKDLLLSFLHDNPNCTDGQRDVNDFIHRDILFKTTLLDTQDEEAGFEKARELLKNYVDTRYGPKGSAARR